MTENTHALEHWLNLQAKEAVATAVSQCTAKLASGVNASANQLVEAVQRVAADLTFAPGEHAYDSDEDFLHRASIVLAAFALRLAAIAHRESVQGDEK